jgi:hypothetical protein
VLGRARVVGFVVTAPIAARRVWRLDLAKVGAAPLARGGLARRRPETAERT